MNLPQVCVCPTPTEPPLTLLPTPSLQVVPKHQLWVPCFMQSTHPGHLFYMVMYMFQCYSFKSFHPCVLPLSPKLGS